MHEMNKPPSRLFLIPCELSIMVASGGDVQVQRD